MRRISPGKYFVFLQISSVADFYGATDCKYFMPLLKFPSTVAESDLAHKGDVLPERYAYMAKA